MILLPFIITKQRRQPKRKSQTIIVSTEFISEALGQSNVRTTQNYLSGFEDKSKREAVKALTASKNRREN